MYVSMLEQNFFIYLWDICPLFSIYQYAYLNVNSLYIKFLQKILPDIASASIAGFKLELVFLSVTFTVIANDEANKVYFVLIDASSKLIETLNLYCITHNT